MPSGVSVLRPTGCIQLVSLWWADRRLSGGRVFLGAGQRDHVQTACPAAGDGRLHRHPSGNGEPTLSGHLQARWESDSLNTRHNDLDQNDDLVSNSLISPVSCGRCLKCLLISCVIAVRSFFLVVTWTLMQTQIIIWVWRSVEWVSCMKRPVSCRALQPVSALRPHGSEQDASAGLESAAQLLLLSGADVQRRLVLQAAHQECRIQESRWRRDACLRRGRGLQLDHGESCQCVWSVECFGLSPDEKTKKCLLYLSWILIKKKTKTFLFHYSVVLLYSSFNYLLGAILQKP